VHFAETKAKRSWLFGIGVEGLDEDVEGALESGGLGGVVDANASGVAEEGSVGEKEAGFFCCFDGGFDFHLPSVDPCEVGGFDVRDVSFGEFLADGGGEKVAVFRKIGEEVLAPFFAVFVSGFGGVVGETVDLGEGVAFGGVEFPANGVIWNDGVI